MKRQTASRFRTVEAIAWVMLARLLVAIVPFRWWRHALGGRIVPPAPMAPPLARHEPLAGNVRNAVARLPFTAKCLPQAMALAWMLRRRGRGYVLKIGVRPPGSRAGEDALHAWVELPEGTALGHAEGQFGIVLAVSGGEPPGRIGS